MMPTPPNSLHYAGLTAQCSQNYCTPTVFIKFSEFESGIEMETEEDRGHTGTRSLYLGEDRTKGFAAPSFTDRLRPEQGLEDFMYHILGTYQKESYGTKTQEYIFTPTDNDLPKVSITHGFNYSTIGARGFPNAIADELEVTMDAEKPPEVKIKYISDFPEYGKTEPTLTFPSNAPPSFKSSQLSAYMGEVGGVNEETDKIPCMTEGNIKISNNIDTSICAGTTIGSVVKDIKELTVEGSFKMRYTGTEYERLWATGSLTGTTMSPNNLTRSLRFKYEGGLIESVSGTDYKYTLQFDIPKANLKFTESESGDDAKTVEAEFKGATHLTDPIVTITCISQLSDLHITP